MNWQLKDDPKPAVKQRLEKKKKSCAAARKTNAKS